MKRKKTPARKRPVAGRRRPRPAGSSVARPVTTAERRSFDGGCHCGAIEYTYTTALLPTRWPVRLCQCGFCRKHGARSTSDSAGELHFRFERPEFLRRYRFALRTADFLICKECGTYVAAVLLSGRGAQAVINLNTLREPPKGLRPGKPVSHDDESGETRRARRVLTWTPVVGPV
ncbi:MAG: aldehyde-activating protein [Gammaproteobacteria bacterium]